MAVNPENLAISQSKICPKGSTYYEIILVNQELYAIIARMIAREKLQTVLDYLDLFPAVALIGPRQSGKTTLAKAVADQRPSIYLDLEASRDRAKLSDAEDYLSRRENKLVILDEIHRMPDIFRELRGLIDSGRQRNIKSNRFLILGSASIDMMKQSSESLAGRIAYVELSVLNLLEIEDSQRERLWIRGGFPESFLADSDKASAVWRENFIRSYLERDIPQLGPRVPAEALSRLWTMVAHVQSSTINLAQLARALDISGKTVSRYLDLLVDLLLVRRLMPFHVNVGKRLVKSPKYYIRDSGIVHSLLGLNSYEEVLGHPAAGGSWESFVIETLLSTTSYRVKPYFYRTSAGAEIDLLLELPGQKYWAVEIKRSLAPSLGKGFHHARTDVNPEHSFVIYSGNERYNKTKGVEVISVREMAEELRGI